MPKHDRYSIIIRRSAAYDDVVVYYGDHFVQIDLSVLDYRKKRDYLNRLVTWALNGYKGNPPTLNQ